MNLAELRDMFAAHALTGLLTDNMPSELRGHPPMAHESEESLAALAYRYADAMLKARGAK